MQKKYSSEAVVLRRRNYHEADRIIILYSKNFGKISLLGKGVRKTGSRKRGSLENFSRIKFSANDSKFMGILTETEIVNTYPRIRKELGRVSLAYYFSEAIDKLTREEEKNTRIYDLLVNYLETLDKGEANLKKLRANFVVELLVELGFWPKDKVLTDHDKKIEEIVERQLSSRRVGEKLFG
jgi:DNA repair protein RecO (recombination protein O)